MQSCLRRVFSFSAKLKDFSLFICGLDFFASFFIKKKEENYKLKNCSAKKLKSFHRFVLLTRNCLI